MGRKIRTLVEVSPCPELAVKKRAVQDGQLPVETEVEGELCRTP